jgi:thermitase
MIRHFARKAGLLGLALALAGTLFGQPAAGADSFVWRKAQGSVDADLTSAELVPVLAQIAKATGWAVFLEPGTKRSITVKFKGRTPEGALDLLLGDLDRVLLPGTNGGPQRLLVFRGSQANATEPIKALDKSKPIPTELIITVKPGTDLDALAKKLGAKIVSRSKGRNSARLSFEDEASAEAARKALESNEDVLSTDPNFAVTDQPLPEDLAGQGRGPSVRPVRDGDPVVVALLDSHVGSLGPEYDAFLLDRINVTSSSAPPSELLEHGSAMFGTALNAMKGDNSGSNVRFVAIDVYGGNAMTTTYELAEGLYQATQNRANILSMSLGAEGDSPYLSRYIDELVRSGYIIVASAGNSPVTTPMYPAAYEGVIAVTAGVSPNQLAPYANRGSFVDVMAPGTSVVNYNGITWKISGTSPAAAFISGYLADKIDSRGLSPKDAVSLILKTFPPAKP